MSENKKEAGNTSHEVKRIESDRIHFFVKSSTMHVADCFAQPQQRYPSHSQLLKMEQFFERCERITHLTPEYLHTELFDNEKVKSSQCTCSKQS